MRHQPIDSSLFVHNRSRLVQKLLPKSLAVFNANDIMPTNADGTMAFVQNADLFYFSGIDQEETILLICPDSQDSKLKEVLFLRETNEKIAIWEGHKYTKDDAKAASGIQQVRWLSEFPLVFNTLMCESDHVYLNTNEHLRAEVVVETRDARFIREAKSKYPFIGLSVWHPSCTNFGL
jgi:Xaa-Pro aminopeptidase